MSFRKNSRRQLCTFGMTASLLFLTCCDLGQENEDPKAQSQRLRTESVQSINQRNYLQAEQLLSQTLPLDQELQQWDRLAEDRATLARVQTSVGLFSSAIGNYVEAWKYYRQIGDNATEIRLMNGIGNIYVGLGDFEKGIGFLSDAVEVSRLASNGETDPESNMNLGNAYTWSGPVSY